MVSRIVELLYDGVVDKVVRQSLNDYFCQEQMIKGGVWSGLMQDLYFCDGVRSPSQNRHKNAQNRAKYSKNKGKSTYTVTKIKLTGLTDQGWS